MKRSVERKMPDGSIRTVYPFHISLEGMESVLLCRDAEDYDRMEKTMFVCSWENNVLIIIHVVMSNHGHLSVLAPDYESARKTGTDILKRYSQYLSYRYPVKGTLHRASVDVQYLDSDWYVSLEQKKRLVPYLKRSFHTSIPQLARCIRLSQTEVRETLSHYI